MSAFVPPPTRFHVSHFPVYDSILGKDGGIMCIYTGYVRRHPWASRQALNELLMDGRGVARLPNGDVYDGDVRLGMFEGMGTMTYSNGNVYEGQWEGGLRHGYGVLDYYLDGGAGKNKKKKGSYTGLFRRGERQGAGFDEMDNGDTFIGQYKEGSTDGPGKLRHAASGVVMDGLFKGGLMHGLCTVTYPSGDVFVGHFREGVPVGKGARFEEVASGDVHLEEYAQDGSGRCLVGVLDISENEILRTGAEGLSTLPNRTISDTKTTTDGSQSSHNNKNDVNSLPTAHVRYACGTREYVGEWRRMAPVGSGLRQGVREGHGTLIFLDSGIVYVGSFLNNEMDGEGIMTFPPATASPTTPDDDQPASPPSSTTPTTHASMVSYQGGFHANKFHGKATVLYSDGTTCEQFFSKGYPKGICHEQLSDTSQRAFFHEMVSLMVNSEFNDDEVFFPTLDPAAGSPNTAVTQSPSSAVVIAAAPSNSSSVDIQDDDVQDVVAASQDVGTKHMPVPNPHYTKVHRHVASSSSSANAAPTAADGTATSSTSSCTHSLLPQTVVSATTTTTEGVEDHHHHPVSHYSPSGVVTTTTTQPTSTTPTTVSRYESYLVKISANPLDYHLRAPPLDI